MSYEEIKENNSDLKEISVIEMEVTFAEDYFVKSDKIKFNFDEGIVISKSYKDKNGNYKLVLIPTGKNPSAIFIPNIPSIQLQECED